MGLLMACEQRTSLYSSVLSTIMMPFISCFSPNRHAYGLANDNSNNTSCKGNNNITPIINCNSLLPSSVVFNVRASSSVRMLFAQEGLSVMDLSKALRSSTVGALVSAIGTGRYQSSFTSPIYALQSGLGLGLGLGLWG